MIYQRVWYAALRPAFIRRLLLLQTQYNNTKWSIAMMSSSSDISVACGDGGSGKGDDEDKTCTSCEQKVEHCEKSDATSSGGSSAYRDAITSFCKAAESEFELYKDPPPKEECPICFLPKVCHLLI